MLEWEWTFGVVLSSLLERASSILAFARGLVGGYGVGVVGEGGYFGGHVGEEWERREQVVELFGRVGFEDEDARAGAGDSPQMNEFALELQLLRVFPFFRHKFGELVITESGGNDKCGFDLEQHAISPCD